MKNWLIVLLFSVASCSTEEKKSMGSETQLSGNALDSEFSVKYPVTLTKQCPHSRCKSYTIQLKGHRLLLQVNSPHKRHDTILLNQEEIKRFNQLLNDLNLQSMKTRLIPHSVSCPSHSSDSPSYQVAIDKGDFSQELQIYMGCHNLAKKYLSFVNWFESRSENRSEF